MDMDMDRQRHKAQGRGAGRGIDGAQGRGTGRGSSRGTDRQRQHGKQTVRQFQVRHGVKSQSFVRVANDVAVRCRTEADREADVDRDEEIAGSAGVDSLTWRRVSSQCSI